MDFLKQIPDNSINLIITSPPYNIGKEYETRTSIEKYIDIQSEVIAQLYL
jgi:DNA modification methylase